ncbi:MAG: hypothetical protein WCY75_06255 [Sulfurimonadaceae bacterium]
MAKYLCASTVSSLAKIARQRIVIRALRMNKIHALDVENEILTQNKIIALFNIIQL